MRLSFCSNNGYMVANYKTQTWLDSLTYKDASDFMSQSGRMSCDRRRSMALISNREWADGVQWK